MREWRSWVNVRQWVSRNRRRVRRRLKRAAQDVRILRHRRRSGQVAISVVIPVYNALPYLRGLLDSLMAQDMAPEQFEVIAVDDGSTDGSGAVLDEYARRFPRLLVVHQPNSGWPGIPRNRGMDLASGRYVFFADADDLIGPSALRRMTEYSDEFDVDVLLPRMVGVGGRWVRDSMYRETVRDADLFVVFRTLSPQKMFRVSMMREHQIRFPEEKVRLEDGMVMAKAYLVARRVSVLADGDHYQIRERDDGQNISAGRLNPEGYSWSTGEVARIIRENAPDRAFADPIVLDLYRRKALKFYSPGRWERTSEKNRRRWLAAHAKVIEAHIPPELEAELEFPFRQRSALVRAQDIAGLDRWMPLEVALWTSASLVDLRLDGTDLAVEVDVPGRAGVRGPDTEDAEEPDVAVDETDEVSRVGSEAAEPGPADSGAAGDDAVQYSLSVTTRNRDDSVEVPLTPVPERPTRLRGLIPVADLRRAQKKIWDLWVQPRTIELEAPPVRVSIAAGHAALRELDAGLSCYATKHGNVSLRFSPTSAAAVDGQGPAVDG